MFTSHAVFWRAYRASQNTTDNWSETKTCETGFDTGIRLTDVWKRRYFLL